MRSNAVPIAAATAGRGCCSTEERRSPPLRSPAPAGASPLVKRELGGSMRAGVRARTMTDMHTKSQCASPDLLLRGERPSITSSAPAAARWGSGGATTSCGRRRGLGGAAIATAGVTGSLLDPAAAATEPPAGGRSQSARGGGGGAAAAAASDDERPSGERSSPPEERSSNGRNTPRGAVIRSTELALLGTD